MKTFSKYTVPFLFLILVTVSSAVSASTSKGLLGEALKLSNSVDSNLTVEQRLEKYEEIQKVVDQILTDHAGTDEGISLLSGQKVGNFDYAEIQNKYIKELTDYYNTVCVVSPSFKCIAFVSLNEGIDSCRTSSDFETLNISHRNIMNALTVFVSQGAKKSYQNLALNSYRNCIAVADIEKTQEIVDYFSIKLVPALLSLGKINQAKATIQKIKDPYFKFVAVIQLKESSGESISKEYIDRLSQYVVQKMSPKDKPMADQLWWFRSQRLAALRLKTELLKLGDGYQETWGVLGNDRALKMQTVRLGWNMGAKKKMSKSCDENFNKNYFEVLVNLIDVSVDSASNSIGKSLNDITSSFFAIDSDPFNLDRCASVTDGSFYGTTLKAYVFVRAYSSQEAKKFLTAAALVNYDADKVLKYFFDLESTYPDLRAVRLKIGTNVEGKGITIRNDFYDFKEFVELAERFNHEMA